MSHLGCSVAILPMLPFIATLQNQLFAAHETQYLLTKVQNLSNGSSSRSGEKGNVK
jgi:hypothetical protein